MGIETWRHFRPKRKLDLQIFVSTFLSSLFPQKKKLHDDFYYDEISKKDYPGIRETEKPWFIER